MSYDELRHLAGTWGLVYMLVLFGAVLVYALWPGNRRKFRAAARMPLDEE